MQEVGVEGALTSETLMLARYFVHHRRFLSKDAFQPQFIDINDSYRSFPDEKTFAFYHAAPPA